MKRHKFLIILITYNAEEYIINCIESLLTQTYRNFDIIIVDNDSEDRTKSIVKNYITKLDNIHLIENHKNHGFACACNIAIKSEFNNRETSHLLLLNQDTIADKNLLEVLSYWIDRKENCTLSPKILIKKNNKLWWMGSKFFTLAELFTNLKLATSYHINKEEDDKWPIEIPQELEVISGCALCIPKNIIDNVGYFDERFFMYGEDLDYSLRIKQKGFKMYLIPGTIVYHDVPLEDEALSIDKSFNKTLKRYFQYFKSTLLLLSKHFSISYNIIWYLRIPFAIFFEIFKRFRNIGSKRKKGKIPSPTT